MHSLAEIGSNAKGAGRKRIENVELMSDKTKKRRFDLLDERLADVGILSRLFLLINPSHVSRRGPVSYRRVAPGKITNARPNVADYWPQLYCNETDSSYYVNSEYSYSEAWNNWYVFGNELHSFAYQKE